MCRAEPKTHSNVGWALKTTHRAEWWTVTMSDYLPVQWYYSRKRTCSRTRVIEPLSRLILSIASGLDVSSWAKNTFERWLSVEDDTQGRMMNGNNEWLSACSMVLFTKKNVFPDKSNWTTIEAYTLDSVWAGCVELSQKHIRTLAERWRRHTGQNDER